MSLKHKAYEQACVSKAFKLLRNRLPYYIARPILYPLTGNFDDTAVARTTALWRLSCLRSDGFVAIRVITLRCRVQVKIYSCRNRVVNVFSSLGELEVFLF